MAWIYVYCVLLLSASALVCGEEQEEVEGGKCERITLSSCQDLGYNWTAMPNLLGHTTQKEAEEAMSAFDELLSSECSPHARFLVCSAFVPLCSEQVSGAVSACRALCEDVSQACGAQLAALAASVRLPCSTFPQRADRRLCMRPPNASEPQPEPAPALTPPEHDQCPPGHRRAPHGACWPACDEDAAYTASEKAARAAWTTAAACLALVSTAFALGTFCAEPGRYRYPERPLVWAAACHLLVAAAEVARHLLGARFVSCAGDTLAVDGLASPTCVAFFIVTYYLTLAADAWVANASVAWYLTAASEWSTEALERAAAYLHAAAWGWAGAWTAAALALRRVAADELAGACGVSAEAAAALIGVPRGAALACALALGAAAAPGVWRVRRALGGRGAARVARLAWRAALVTLAYAICAGTGAALRVAGAAAARGSWAGVGAAAGAEAGAARHTAALLGALGAAASAAAGAAAGAWAWTGKSLRVWRRALCAPREPRCCSPPLLRPHHPYYKRPLHVSRV